METVVSDRNLQTNTSTILRVVMKKQDIKRAANSNAKSVVAREIISGKEGAGERVPSQRRYCLGKEEAVKCSISTSSDPFPACNMLVILCARSLHLFVSCQSTNLKMKYLCGCSGDWPLFPPQMYSDRGLAVQPVQPIRKYLGT